MAYDYNKYKSVYEWLNDDQRQKWDAKYGNTDQYKQFKADYEKETNNTPQQNTNTANFNNQNGTNWQNQTQTPTNPISQQPVDMTVEEYRKNQNNNQNFNVSPDLDQSKFQQDPWKITVQEWTAQQTGRPDYQASSEARLNEMKGNLDHYFATSPRMFSDRETFNKVFEYNTRESEAQRQLLDSYWKRKEDMDRASQYTSWEAIMNWMKNWEITTDQLNLLKDNDPESYRKWQELQEEEIKKRIVNDIVPPILENISSQFINMMNSLGIQPQDALDIEWIYNDTMDRTWAWQTLEDANRTVRQIEEITNRKTAIMNRYAASTWGTVSDALAAARMQKAIAPYDAQLQGLQYQYQDYANLYNQKLATATQAAQVRQMQASENQRVWNQRLTALWFAADALSYRTPEQQAQLKLQTQQAMNEMELLQQSRLNDLDRYNQYAVTKLQNQLNSELTDLTVEDETQLRANLNNVLDGYYNQRWAIIQRSQGQAVDDIIAYAKKNGVSVAEALTQNFIKPLQSKKEYKTKVSQDYWMDKYQQQYSYTIDENWNVRITATWYGEIPQDAFKTRASRQEAYGDVYDASWTWADYVENLAWSIKDWSYGWQCGAFCNDVLLAWDDSKVFWNSLQDKIKACNVKKEDWPQVWYAVVFDLWFMSKDWINHGHVGFISAVNWDWSIDVLESNWKSDETIHVKRYSKAAVDQMVMWYYKPSNYDVQKEANSYAPSTWYTEWAANDPYSWVAGVTSWWAEVNAWGWITDLEDQYLKDRQNEKQMISTLSDYWITTLEYNAQKRKYADYQAKVSLIEDTKKMYESVQDLLTWQENHRGKHTWRIDRATYETIETGVAQYNPWYLWWQLSQKWNSETANGINKFNYVKKNQLLERFQELKKAGATFWPMSNAEWNIVWDAASKLSWLTSDSEFENTLKQMLNSYGNILADAGVEWFYNTDI